MSFARGTVKSVAFRIFFGWLAAHRGCVFGNEAFFWAFNSLQSVITNYNSEWPQYLSQIIELQKVKYTLEFAIACLIANVMDVV
jgi:hypothetical protein